MLDWAKHMLAGAVMSVAHLPLYPFLMGLFGHPTMDLVWWSGYIGTFAALVGWTIYAAWQVQRINKASRQETNSQRRRRLRGRKVKRYGA